MPDLLLTGDARGTIAVEMYTDSATGYYTIELDGTPIYQTVFATRAALVYDHLLTLGDDLLALAIADYDTAGDDTRHEYMMVLERQAGAAL